jgi:hypothetical protein
VNSVKIRKTNFRLETAPNFGKFYGPKVSGIQKLNNFCLDEKIDWLELFWEKFRKPPPKIIPQLWGWITQNWGQISKFCYIKAPKIYLGTEPTFENPPSYYPQKVSIPWQNFQNFGFPEMSHGGLIRQCSDRIQGKIFWFPTTSLSPIFEFWR